MSCPHCGCPWYETLLQVARCANPNCAWADERILQNMTHNDLCNLLTWVSNKAYALEMLLDEGMRVVTLGEWQAVRQWARETEAAL